MTFSSARVFCFDVVLRRCWQLEFSLNVEEYVCLALGHRLLVRGHHVGVVKVEPMVVLDDECRVMARTSPGNNRKINY